METVENIGCAALLGLPAVPFLDTIFWGGVAWLVFSALIIALILLDRAFPNLWNWALSKIEPHKGCNHG